MEDFNIKILLWQPCDTIHEVVRSCSSFEESQNTWLNSTTPQMKRKAETLSYLLRVEIENKINDNYKHLSVLT